LLIRILTPIAVSQPGDSACGLFSLSKFDKHDG
jgi:hypothetical protein